MSKSLSRKAKPIKGIIFDAFDTLVKPKIPPWQQYALEARKLGCEFKDEDLKQAFKLAFKQTSSNYPIYGLHSNPPLSSPDEWWEKLILKTFSSTPSLSISNENLTRNVLPILVPRLLKRFSTKEAYELFPEVEFSLKKLREFKEPELRLGLATNSDSRILNVLNEFQLNRFLNLDVKKDHSVSHDDDYTIEGKEEGEPTLSYSEGFEKPNPEFFRIATQRLFPELKKIHLSTEDLNSIIHVGDQLEEDYLGARKAGLKAFWLKRKGEDDRSRPEVEFKVFNDERDLNLIHEIKRDTVESLDEVVERVRLINES